MGLRLKNNLHYILVNKIHFLFVLCSSIVFAQKTITIADINKQFEEVNLYVNTANLEKAIPLLETIKKDCLNINYKFGITRIGHTLAILYFNTSNYKKVITLDEEYIKTGVEILDYEKLSHIHRLKGCAYAELGLLNKSSEELLQALDYAKKININNNKYYAKSLIYSNLAGQYKKDKTIQDSIFSNINKSIQQAEKISEVSESFISKKYSLIAYSHMIMANEYSNLNNTKHAEKYFLKSLEIHNTKPIVLVERAVLQSQLGSFYYKKKEFEKAIKYSELGVSVEKKASFPQIRRDLFETLSKSYLEQNEIENSKKFLSLFIALNDSITNVEKNTVDTVLKNTVSKQEKRFLDDISRRTLVYTLSNATLVVLGILFFFYYKRLKQNQIKKIEIILEKLKAQHIDSQDVLLAENITIKENEAEKILMSVEAEKKLLEKLNNFEKKMLYLERKTSLPYVAAEIETNTKYLSYIIKKHKGKDFKKYINDLKINYIVQKINDNPIYRNYKINFLAEETGFSSHSKFATVFKNTIGVSPSEFINNFEKNKNNN